LLGSLQEIQPNFEEEAKAYAGLWRQGKEEEEYVRCCKILVMDS
jgi:hypothetical protein